MSSYTAIRTTRGTKATVTVYDADGAVVGKAGGKRAERAQAVILAQWVNSRYGYGDLQIYGLRADAQAAEREAHKLATQTESRTRYGVVGVTPATVAIAVPVTDAA